MLPSSSGVATNSRLSYRPDIDGLRALAVLLVIATHFEVRGITGGYIGVDVFFVISGYLISSIIMPQIANGSFSLLAFYERRIRRIFPALFVMLVATIPLAWHFLLPKEMLQYARTLLASLFASSNMVQITWMGYFDKGNALKPLMHTWSLGVEEQFYLVFPLLLLGLARFRSNRTIKLWIWILTILSFVFACLAVRSLAGVAFFLSPLRTWELLLGAILSQDYLPSLRTPIQRNIAGGIGLLCIFVPAFVYDSKTHFPGLSAVPPCLGAILIIAAGQTGSALTVRLLSLRPLVFTGLISYSLYLWHWPLLVFFRFQKLQTCTGMDCNPEPHFRGQLVLFALTMAIGTLSWRYVETPFRKRRVCQNRRQIFVCSGVAALSAAIFCIFVGKTNGAQFRFDPQALSAANFLNSDDIKANRWGVCALGDPLGMSQFKPKVCLPFTPGRTHYLLLGDSHAAQLWWGLSTIFPGMELGQLNAGSCNLLLNQTKSTDSACRDTANYLYQQLLLSGQVDTIILSALWKDRDLPEIAKFVDYVRAHHINIILVGPNIDYDLDMPRLLTRIYMHGSNGDTLQSHAYPHSRELDAQMAHLARDEWKIPYISYYADLCPPQTGCPGFAAPGVPMMFDTNHLTSAGSILFAQSMRDHHQLP